MGTTDVPGVSGQGRVRTDMDCHQCGKGFVAELDFDVDGNHIVECPRCGHEHCRVIKKGVITGDRWDTRSQRVNVDKRCVWRSDAVPATTSVASVFIRDAWLNRGDMLL